jgi:hypothetical protein
MSYSQKHNKNLTSISVIDEISKKDISQFKNWTISRRAYYEFICNFTLNDSLIYRCVIRYTKKKKMFVQETDPIWDHGEFLFEDKFEKSDRVYPFKTEEFKDIINTMLILEIESIQNRKENNADILCFFGYTNSILYCFEKDVTPRLAVGVPAARQRLAQRIFVESVFRSFQTSLRSKRAKKRNEENECNVWNENSLTSIHSLISFFILLL